MELIFDNLFLLNTVAHAANEYDWKLDIGGTISLPGNKCKFIAFTKEYVKFEIKDRL